MPQAFYESPQELKNGFDYLGGWSKRVLKRVFQDVNV